MREKKERMMRITQVARIALLFGVTVTLSAGIPDASGVPMLSPAPPIVSTTTTPAAMFMRQAATTDAFSRMASDQTGNQADTKPAPQATPPVVSALPGDLNGDGAVDCRDLAIVKASFGKRNGQPGFDPRADTNGDGVVDIKDLAFVSQQLPAGTRCP
jgi:hypothetical protein